MKVKFVRDNQDYVYNFDGLTKGFVYDVISVSHKNRDLLKIKNDNNYIRYYHKDLFIEVYEDAEDNILSYLSEENIDRIPKDNDERIRFMDAIQILFDIIKRYKGTREEPNIVTITKGFELYPEILVELITNYMDDIIYMKGVNVTQEVLCECKNHKYKLDGKGPIMVLHENDKHLIGKRIFFNGRDNIRF